MQRLEICPVNLGVIPCRSSEDTVVRSIPFPLHINNINRKMMRENVIYYVVNTLLQLSASISSKQREVQKKLKRT